jgi:hypothetical protein
MALLHEVEPLPETEQVAGPEIVEEAAPASEPEPEPELTPAAEVTQQEPAIEDAEEPAGLFFEPEVIKPEVPETVTAEAAIVEPEALPDLPEPELAEAEAAEAESEPEAGAEEPEPLAAEAEPEPEAGAEEPEPVVSEAEPQEPEPAQEEPAWQEHEPVMAEAPAPLEEETAAAGAGGPFGSPDTSVWGDFEREESPAPEPAPPEPEPQPRTPEPEPVQAAATQPPAQGIEDVRSTMVAWPSTNPPSTNGTPSQAQAFDEATSVIPAWQNPEPGADPKRTVSLQAVPTEQITSGTGIAALLTFETGPFAGRIIAVPSQMITVGRAPDNDVVVGDPATSGHHGRIDVRGGAFWVSDLGSTNGTLVNGEPVIEKQLSDGDLISIGQSTIRFTLEA